MDKSFLSQANVAAASRDFVCIRLSTYENAEEAEFLSKLYTGRTGQLENSVFAILSPDGKIPLVKAGRGPQFAFRNSRGMVDGMKKIAADFKDAKPALSDNTLPLMASVDLGLNVAACDSLPLIVTIGSDDAQAKQLNKSMVKLAWDKHLAGQYVFATTSNATKHLKPITGLTKDAAIAIISPGEFGVSGKVLAQFKADATREDIRKAMMSVAARNRHTTKDRKSHNAAGIALGLDWKTEIPVTDQMSLKAKERIRGRK